MPMSDDNAQLFYGIDMYPLYNNLIFFIMVCKSYSMTYHPKSGSPFLVTLVKRPEKTCTSLSPYECFNLCGWLYKA